MANDVTIDPRYSKYTNQEIERILDSVETIDTEPTEDSPNPVSSGGVAGALGNYPTSEQMSEALGNYYTKEEADELLSKKQDNSTLADKQDVINIVENFGKEPAPEPEPEEEEA